MLGRADRAGQTGLRVANMIEFSAATHRRALIENGRMVGGSVRAFVQEKRTPRINHTLICSPKPQVRSTAHES
jgi:hypothetical protein